MWSSRLAVVLCLVLLLSLLPAAFVFPQSAPPEQSKPFTFVVFGDNRPNRPVPEQPEVFKKILTEIDAIDPAFAVNTGDCIYGSSRLSRVKEQYKAYQNTVKQRMRAKVYLAIGNHEINWNPTYQDYFAEEMGPLYYSFDYGDSHFIVLNSETIDEQARIMGEQFEWLKDDLWKSRAARHRFVFMHRPVFPVSGHKGKCLDKFPKERDDLHSLFVRNRITAVFCGHEHLFHEETRNGVRYVITGGAGAFLYSLVGGGGNFHHYVVVNINGDNVEMKAVKVAQAGRPAETISFRGNR